MSWYLLDPWRVVHGEFGRRSEGAEGTCSCVSLSMPEVTVDWAGGSENLLLCRNECAGPSEGTGVLKVGKTSFHYSLVALTSPAIIESTLSSILLITYTIGGICNIGIQVAFSR